MVPRSSVSSQDYMRQKKIELKYVGIFAQKLIVGVGLIIHTQLRIIDSKYFVLCTSFPSISFHIIMYITYFLLQGKYRIC